VKWFVEDTHVNFRVRFTWLLAAMLSLEDVSVQGLDTSRHSENCFCGVEEKFRKKTKASRRSWKIACLVCQFVLI
jgi:hypothetical protein